VVSKKYYSNQDVLEYTISYEYDSSGRIVSEKLRREPFYASGANDPYDAKYIY
jgi:hypothetical protein